MRHGGTFAVARDEVLEELWTARECGRLIDPDRLAADIHTELEWDWAPVVEALVADGLARRQGRLLELTPAGEEVARPLIRRQRLAELLLNQVLELDMAETERTACRMEHVLSTEATDAVCSFLGHPPVCPHGRAIPQGACCGRQRAPVAPLLLRLAELEVGTPGRVVLVAPAAGERLDQLTDLGLLPGATVRLRQRHPSIVVEVDHTQLAIDAAIARTILVRRAPDPIAS